MNFLMHCLSNKYIKKKKLFFEKHITLSNNKKIKFLNIKAKNNLIKRIKKLNLISGGNIIEYPMEALKLLETISKKINRFDGGLLIIDYGYIEKTMKNSLQSVYKHKFSNFLKNIGKSDITYNISFHLIKRILKKLNLKVAGIINQKNFLIKLGIMQRAEILAKNLKFSEKANIYFRINRLIDNKFMGNLFKVMFVTKKNNKFNTGFKN